MIPTYIFFKIIKLFFFFFIVLFLFLFFVVIIVVLHLLPSFTRTKKSCNCIVRENSLKKQIFFFCHLWRRISLPLSSSVRNTGLCDSGISLSLSKKLFLRTENATRMD